MTTKRAYTLACGLGGAWGGWVFVKLADTIFYLFAPALAWFLVAVITISLAGIILFLYFASQTPKTTACITTSLSSKTIETRADGFVVTVQTESIAHTVVSD